MALDIGHGSSSEGETLAKRELVKINGVVLVCVTVGALALFA